MMTEKAKKPSSLLSVIRAALAHSRREADSTRSGLTSPHIRSDPVPTAFRKSVPQCAPGNLSHSLSVTSRCLSVGQSVTITECEDRNYSGFNTPRLFQNEKLGLTQLSFSNFAHQNTEALASAEWGTVNDSEDDEECELELQVPGLSPGSHKDSMLQHWIVEQSAQCGNAS